MPRTRVQGLCPFQGSNGVLRKREVDGREGREGNSRRVLLEGTTALQSSGDPQERTVGGDVFDSDCVLRVLRSDRRECCLFSDSQTVVLLFSCPVVSDSS